MKTMQALMAKIRTLFTGSTLKNNPDRCNSAWMESLENRVCLSAAPINFTDADGSAVRITLAGNGAMTLTPTGNTYDLAVTGTDQGSSLTISARNGDKKAELHNISISGAIRLISAGTTDLSGNLSITGSVGQLLLHDVTGALQHTFTIGGTSAAKPASITLHDVSDLTLTSGAPLQTLNVNNWTDTTNDDKLTTPSIQTLTVRKDFAPGLSLDGTAKTIYAMRVVNITGAVSGVWSINGDVLQITAGSTTNSFSSNFKEDLTTLTVRGGFSGTLAANSFLRVTIYGNVTDGKILAGADLGDDAKIGGTGVNQDLYFRGTIGFVLIRGQFNQSFLGAGLDPAGGAFGNPNEFVTGKNGSSIRSLTVGGTADTTSRFAAGKFPASVSVGRTRVDPPGDPRFILASTLPDTTPPTIVANLVNDTGTPGDNITSDPSITGRVTDLGRITSLRVGIDGQSLLQFTNILSLLQPNGTFTITRALLEKINDGPLATNPVQVNNEPYAVHKVSITAKDDVGNTTPLFTVTFTFDPTAV